MRALVVYESMYGNTHVIADHIATGLRSRFTAVSVVPAAEAAPHVLDRADFIVVGGPTHVHGMARPTSRKSALDAAAADESLHLEPTATRPGVREWLKALPPGTSMPAAAFDTRLDGNPMWTGRASKAIAHRLRRHGFRVDTDPESFLVDKHNRLLDGEADRAEAWGAAIAELVAPATLTA